VFVAAYLMLFVDPPVAALMAWLVSMTSRQAGHFFFEPRTYDHVNLVTHVHKEAIKVGYNLRRKWTLMGVWVAMPAWIMLDPTMLSLSQGWDGWVGFARHVGWAWLALGVAGLLVRAVHLALQGKMLTACAWVAKVLTDPFHDIQLYHRAPFHLLRGERLDPMHHVKAEIALRNQSDSS